MYNLSGAFADAAPFYAPRVLQWPGPLARWGRGLAMRVTQPLWRYRLNVASRTLAAAAGGYALAAAVAAALSLVLIPALARADAVLTATMLAWFAYAAAAGWAFYARSAWAAWVGSLLPALALGALALALRSPGAAP